MEPAEQVGMRLAHIILSDLTQDSLSAFHSAGIERSGEEQGLQDILDGNTRNDISSMTIVGTRVDDIKRDILCRTFKYYILNITNSILEDIRGDDFWYAIGDTLGIWKDRPNIDEDKNIIIVRFYLDYGKLRKDGRTLRDVIDNIFGYRYLKIYNSPDFLGIIDVYINNLLELSGVIQLVDKTFGIPEVTSCTKTSDTTLVTSGSNLQEVCIHKYVDAQETISNNLYDVEMTFGLEAARKVIYDEVISNGRDKDAATFMADFMTCKGHVSPFQKDNPMLKDKGFLPSIAYERPKRDLKRILGKRRVDVDSSVYSQFILGKLPDVGTGSKLYETF
jgi:hypothetical protein